MKSKTILLCLLILMSIQFTGCVKTESSTKANGNDTINTNITSIMEKKRIDIYIAINFEKSTDKPFVTIVDKEIIKEISKILKESTPIPGILDVLAPDYVMNIYKSEKEMETIELWVGEEGTKGMWMNKNNTNTGYTISAANTQRIKQILTDEKK